MRALSHSPGILRTSVAAFAAVALAATLSACGSDDDDTATKPSDSATSVASATPTIDLSSVSLNVAVEDTGGWDLELAQAGLDDFPYKVTWVRLATGNLVVQSLASNAIDIGRTSDIPPLFAPDGAVKTIGFLHQPVIDAPGGFQVLAPKGSSIKTPADLAGKKVGYTEATATQYALLKVLDQAGLTWDDITPVKLTLADGLAALTGGQVDALSTLGQPALLASQAGATPVGDYSKPFTSGNTLVVTRPDVLTDSGKVAAITDLLSRLAQATAWETAHPEDWIKAQTTDQRTDYDSALARYQATMKAGTIAWSGPTPDAIAAQQDVADAFFGAGVLRAEIDISKTWDDTFASAFPKGA